MLVVAVIAFGGGILMAASLGEFVMPARQPNCICFEE